MAVASRKLRRGPIRFFWELREGSRLQASVIFALIFKEFKNRTGRNSRLGMLWVVIDPMMQTLSFSAMWYLLGRTTVAGVNVLLFIAVASAPYTIVQMGIAAIPRSLMANRIFYNYQQVKPIDSVIAEFILNMTLLMIGEVLIYFLLWWFMDLTINLENALPLLALLVLSMAISFGIALTVATYSAIYDNIPRFLAILSRPLIFVSSLFFATNDLPASARYYLSWNPIVHLIEYSRYYALDMKPFPELDLTYVLVFALSCLFFGLLTYAANSRRLFTR